MRKTALRGEIEGLRAVAVLLVLAFHAGLPVHGGFIGVDIFFVISGYLITTLLLKEALARDSISLLAFYARRAKRLLPAATVVSLGTLVSLQVLAGRGDRRIFSLDGAASASFVANWRFALRAVDYQAEDLGRSPFLHFWSLSVEEQFYFIWPFLIIAALKCGKKLGWDLRWTLGGALAFVALPSFVASVLSATESESFFATTTRLWELSLGATIAIFGSFLQVRGRTALSICSGVGLGLIGVSVVFVDAETPWPSFWALGPTLGTALVIVGGTQGCDQWLLKRLACRPLQAIGAISYSLYLWHWPFLVVGQDWLGLEGASWGVVLVGISVVPALLSYHLIEQPIRRSRVLTESSPLALSLGFNLTLVTLVCALVIAGLSVEQGSQADEKVKLTFSGGKFRVQPAKLGAAALGRHPNRSSARIPKDQISTIIPDDFGKNDDTKAHERGCQPGLKAKKASWCASGDMASSKRVVLLGDSKMLQYFDALEAYFTARNYKIEIATKAGCPFTEAVVYKKKRRRTECDTANKDTLARLLKAPPDLVLTSQAPYVGFFRRESGKPQSQDVVDGMVTYWALLKERGVEIGVVLDNPRPPFSKPIYDCIAKNSGQLTKCIFTREEGTRSSGEPQQDEAIRRSPGVHVVDLNDFICPGGTCLPVIGGVAVYRDSNHVTGTYALTMTPQIASALDPILRKSAKPDVAAKQD
jgi:peptidoglycan/LPS O-acetylase OafA/YrhL